MKREHTCAYVIIDYTDIFISVKHASVLLAVCSGKHYRKKQRCMEQAMSCSGGQAKNGHGFMPVPDKSLKVTVI